MTLSYLQKTFQVILNKLSLHICPLSQSLLNRTSINKLTLLGFTFVAMPLVMALLFSASNVNQLALKSTDDIYHVAQLTQLNSKLDDSIAKIERAASQYVVLKDRELLIVFSQYQSSLEKVIEETLLKESDPSLQKLLLSLKNESDRIRSLMLSDKIDSYALDEIQTELKTFHLINSQLEKRSNYVVNQQVIDIQRSSENISNNILEHLYIIPITLLIAGIFIVLISKPLKRLTDKIQSLEQGNFENEIHANGPAEVRAIADALENMRQRLHTLELQKSSFIRHISHELKTPLAAIREGTELIYDKSVGPLNDDQQEICNIIRDSVSRLQRLIEDLLDFNIVLDSTSLQGLEKVCLPELIDNAANVRKLDIKSKNISLNYNDKPYFFYSNSKQLSVILDNILSNAIKYSNTDGIIDITHFCDKEILTVNIVDQGPGIDSSLSDKVFDAFYQGKPPENSSIKGSGLGLTIVKELLLRLNGSIKIQPANSVNTSYKQGTCVTITLPKNIPRTDEEITILSSKKRRITDI